MSEVNEKGLSLIDQAKMEINMLWQEMSTMGANDFEPSAIKNILDRLEEGKLSPQDAVVEARKIRAAKQDYH